MALTKNSQIDLNGNEMILDADGDTTITADTDDQIDFKTAGSDRVTINSSGNVGIGTTNPETKVEISGSADNGLLQALQITNTDHASGETGQKVAINFKLSRAGTMRDAARITANKSDDWDAASNVDSYLSFDTALNDTRAEKMRLDENGKLTLLADAGYIADDSSGILQLRTHSTAGGWGISARNYTNSTTGYWYIGKQLNGTNIFSMTSDSDSIDLTFLSDERMKMNITDSANVLDKVKQITVKDFDWRTELNGDTKDDSRPHKEYGFIAQNFQDIGLGQYVKELMPTDESDDTLGMDYGNITPILVKAIQEQQTIIEDLKARIATLEGS
jgi:hypothetical protein